jgi:WD40 repeat protein
METTYEYGRPFSMEVSISGDGKFVAGVNGGSEFWELWDAQSGELRMTGDSHDGTGTCICKLTEGGLRESVDLKCPLRAHSSGILSVALSPTGKLLATAGKDGAVILWVVETGHAQHVMKGHYEAYPESKLCRTGQGGVPISLSFSPDGAQLANGVSGVLKETGAGIHIWDTHTGALLRTLPQACDELCYVTVYRVQFSRDSSALVCAEEDGFLWSAPDDAVVWWDLDSGEPTILHRNQSMKCLVLSPDGRTIACNHDAGGVGNVGSGAELPLSIFHLGNTNIAAFSVDSSKIVTNLRDYGVDPPRTSATWQVRDVSTGELVHTLELGSNVCALAWGRDWVHDMRAISFAMGLLPRLGEGSHVLELSPDVLRIILDRAM